MNLVLVFCRKPPEITADADAEEEAIAEDPDALTPERVAELRTIVKAIHLQRLRNQQGDPDSEESDGYVTEEEEDQKPHSTEAGQNKNENKTDDKLKQQ